ncbi:MAG: hypothetical protein ACREI8_14400 [Myxococcota bacterium]
MLESDGDQDRSEADHPKPEGETGERDQHRPGRQEEQVQHLAAVDRRSPVQIDHLVQVVTDRRKQGFAQGRAQHARKGRDADGHEEERRDEERQEQADLGARQVALGPEPARARAD